MLSDLLPALSVIGLVWLTGWLLSLVLIASLLARERKWGGYGSSRSDVATMVICSVLSWPLALGFAVWLFVLRRR
jgi:hypothetical protein